MTRAVGRYCGRLIAVTLLVHVPLVAWAYIDWRRHVRG